MQTENAQPGRRNGIALLIAAGIIAALIAVVFSFSAGVRADRCKDLPPTGTTTNPTPVPDLHEDLEGDVCGDGDHENTPHAAISSTEPGATVSIKLTTTADVAIDPGDTITVDFMGPTADSGFILPVRIANPTSTTSRVTINFGATEIKPSIQVQGTRVSLTVPTGQSVSKGEYTIIFKKTAGIKNPYYSNPNYEGNRVITIDDGDAVPDTNKVVIRRRTTLTPSEGQRGDDVTLQGKGYAKGTVTIFDGDPANQDSEIIATEETHNGEFSVLHLKANPKQGVPEYTVWTKDSEGIIGSATFRIISATTTFEPATAVVGSPLKIIISDWQDRKVGVAAVRIAGEDAYVSGAIEYENCIDYTGRQTADDSHILTLDVTVPDGILPGQQTVSLYDHDQLQPSGGDGSNDVPCTDATGRGEPTDNVVTATLPSSATPVIQEIVEIVVVDTVAPTTPSLRIVPRNELGQFVSGNEVQRSNTFDLVGEDFPIGTVTIFDGNDAVIDDGEILRTVLVTSTEGDSFTETGFRVRGIPDSLEYKLWAIDSEGRPSGPAIFRITKPTTTFRPSRVVAGSMLNITVSDWQLVGDGVAVVEIAGQQAYGVTTYNQGTDYCYDDTSLQSAVSNVLSFDIQVPSGTLPGMQLVEVYTEDQLNGMPCSDTTGWTMQPNAELKTNAIPVIEELVEIVLDAMDPETITVTPSEGARNTEFTIRVEEYPEGTVTFFHDANGDDIADPEEILDIKVVPSSGTRTSARLTAADGTPGSLTYEVKILDSVGDVRSVIYHITESTTSFEPDKARVGDIVTINISDWQHDDKGVASVLIQGRQAYGVTEYQDPDNPLIYCYDNTGLESANPENVVSFEVNVPDGTLPGMQTVEVYTEEQLEHDPCTVTNINTWTRQPDRDATLASDATPEIRKTIEIVSELPEPTRRVNILEVDGGLDQELEFEVNPPREDPGSYFDAGDKIEITLPEFALPETVANSKIEISGSAHADTATPTRVDILSKKLILTLPGSVAHSPSEYLIITIRQGTGILTPEIPRGFDDPNEGYPVTITFVDADSVSPGVDADDENIVVVKNPISSTVPGATVRVTLVANSEVLIGSSEEIVVDFSGPSADSEFFVPASISNTRITIRPQGRSSFNPSEVLVQGARVDLTIPSGTNAKSIPAGEFTITFSNLARIRNPLAAGTRDIKVSSFVEGDLEDMIKAVIRRTTTIDTLEGPRGTEFILEGKGYPQGAVTVYHDIDCDGNIDAGETLASDSTVRGTFSVDLVAREPSELDTPGCPLDPLVYRIKAKDSEGVDDEVVFRIRSGMFFRPSPARVGAPLKITISDWQNEHQDVAAVSIAGESAHVAGVREYDKCFDYTGVFRANSDGVVSLELVVPRHVPGGQQTVAVYDHEQLDHINEDGNVVPDKGPCADLPNTEDKGNPVFSNVKARLKSEPIAIIKETIQIDTENLTLSPPTAARGQKITITGFGFTRAARGSNHIDSVSIGGIRVADDHSEMVVGTGGDFAITATVPLDIADGSHDVLIEGNDGTLGRATLTIAEATITLDPAQGHWGTEFKVTGRGFIARGVVDLTYGPDVSPWEDALVLADAQGNFELTFMVPFTAKVGNSYKVRAVAEANAGGSTVTVEAEANHLVPKSAIATSPAPVSPGDRMIIRAQSLPAFAYMRAITIGGINVFNNSGVATDENGSLEADVLIPYLDFGDHTLMVQVGDVVVTHIIEVAPPPLSGPPSQVFKYLIRDGNLLTVWRYDNATQSWSLFDPLLAGEVAELNDLTEVGSGYILWVNLSKPQSFQGSGLVAGWNLIRLK